MKARRALGGRFMGRNLGAGVWRLATETSSGPEIYLAGVEPDAAETLRVGGASGVGGVEIDWRAEGVLVTITSAGTPLRVRARHAVIHEPLGRLYEGLPLEQFDNAARRFWARIFRLVRIPGGRHLLGLIARRGRR